MPLYKFVGNRILTTIAEPSAARAAERVAFGLSTVFDRRAAADSVSSQQQRLSLRHRNHHPVAVVGQRIERFRFRLITAMRSPTSTASCTRKMPVACLKARAQEWSIFYDRKFDCLPAGATRQPYTPKFDFESTHTLARDRIPPGARVLDIGCAGGYLGDTLRTRGCQRPASTPCRSDRHRRWMLSTFTISIVVRFPLDLRFRLRDHARRDRASRISRKLRRRFSRRRIRAIGAQAVVSTGNVAFIIVRLMLLLGQFNYGKRGILDLTHTRLFTFATFSRLFEQSGFDVLEMRGVPAPFPLAVGNGVRGRC